jgi:hypothetical protein
MQLQRCSRTDGFRVAPARQLRCCRCKRVSGTTAGLRQPLLVARTQVVAEKRLRFTTPGQAAATTAAAGAFRRRYAIAICNGVLFPTGGLRPPRSCCRANVCQRKNDFCDARTHMHKSGGRQPAVGMSNAVAIADAFVQRPASARCWSETTVATATRWISAFRVRIPSTSHGGLTPPLLRCSANVCRRKTIFAMHERTFTRAATVSPPWVCKSRVRRRCDEFWPLELACGAHSTGLTPPALGAERTFAGEKTIFAMR